MYRTSRLLSPMGGRRQAVQERINLIERSRPLEGNVLVDSYHRTHDYLRISLTERCNLRCTYCMPEQGVPLLPKDSLMGSDELLRLSTLFVGQGVSKIRLTGGEPTLRRDLIDIVGQLSDLKLKSLGMTSNGIALKRKLVHLVKSGLTHLNLSLDTMDQFKYELMTRRRGFSAVMDCIDQALALPITLKINCVVIRGVNDKEVLDFVKLAQQSNIVVRFIEYMPFEDNKWSTQKLVPSQTLIDEIRLEHPNLFKLKDDKNDTTRAYSAPNWKGSVGFISSMSDHFCGTCSRLRLSADGRMKVCLFGPPKLNLLEMLRSGATDEELTQHIKAALYTKKFSHDGHPTPQSIRDNGTSGPMVSIGRLPFLSSSSSKPSLRSYSTKNSKLSHLDTDGNAAMVDVSRKRETFRTAKAVGQLYIGKEAYTLLKQDGSVNSKGDVVTVAKIAGILAAKQTSSLIPMCHQVPLANVKIDIAFGDHFTLHVSAETTCTGQTGVEMEALVATQITLATLWDMLKSVAGKEMRITDVYVQEKSGGKSGDWSR